MELRRESLITWIKCLLIVFVLILPARCYNGYYLHAFEIESNISIQYINFVDLAIVFLTTIICLDDKRAFTNHHIILVCTGYVLSTLFFMGIMLLKGYSSFAGELISKSAIVICSGIIASHISFYSDIQKVSIYGITFCILAFASFFFKDYGSYEESNRVGSIGFGSNETAEFACTLLAICFFAKKLNIVLKCSGAILGVLCLLNVSSRRGLIAGIVVTVIWLFSQVYKIKQKVSHPLKSLMSLIVLGGIIIIFYVYYGEQIIDYISSSSLISRINYYSNTDKELFETNDRELLFDDTFEYMWNHPIFGTFGCDTIYAQGKNSHAHNLFLQLITTYGIVFGCVFSFYIISTVIKSFVVLFHKKKKDLCDFSTVLFSFLVIDLFFESFGYMLWNPKGLLLFSITVFLINDEYIKYKTEFILSSGKEVSGIHLQKEEPIKTTC